MEKISSIKTPSENFGFPSHLVSPDKKGKDWCLKYMKAFHREHTVGGGTILRNATETYAKWRMYANGKQPIDQYKDLMGVREVNGKRKHSWRVLDYSILPIMPKFKKVIINKILTQKKQFKIKAIDPYSMNKERQRRNEILNYMSNQEFLKSVTDRTGIEFESPIEEGMPVPQNTQQLDLYMNLYPKQRYAAELSDELELCMTVNDFEQIRREYVTDIVEVGIGGTRTYIDSNGYIKIRRVCPERTITNAVEKEDFSDMIRVGEYVPMTISELRQMAPKGTFTEKQLAALASKVSGRSYSSPNMQAYDVNVGYPYDNEKVQTLWGQWFSADQWAHVVSKNKEGMAVIKKDNPFWLEKAGYTDEAYSQFYKENGEERYILRNEIKNVYQGIWIVDTEHIFNYGLKTNMVRAQSSLADTKLDYNFYTLNFDSIMRYAEPVLDQIQINWLHLQNHVANSRPDGLLIGKSAIGNITLGGKGGTVMEPDDIVRMYYEKGSYVYKDTDAQGRPLQSKPVEWVKGGVSDAAMIHFDLMMKKVGLLRDILGVNELSDASTPDTDIGKDVAEQARLGTDIALGDIFYADHKVFENTGKTISQLIPDARKNGKNRGWVNALGEESQLFWEQNADESPDCSVKLQDGFSKESKMSIVTAATQSLKANGGNLQPQDLYIIETEENPDKAYMILDAKIRQRTQEEQQRASALQKENAQNQSQAGQDVEAAKQQTLQMTQDWEREKFMMEKDKANHDFQLNLILEKVKQGHTLDENEQLFYQNQQLQAQKLAADLQKARIAAASKPKVKKAA